MNPIPISLYEQLLPKLVKVLELTQNPKQNAAGGLDPEVKQQLLKATTDFKASLAQARELAVNLPGGEQMSEEQDEVIVMLEALRDRKRAQLAEFATRKVASKPQGVHVKLEVDSNASTPFNG